MRKLATAAAVSLVLASGGVRALGLGDIEMRSALNQPMNAEIRLTSVDSGELTGMIVQLASSDAFTRAGIERTKSLQNLQFTVDESGGVPVIRITSNRPVIEPFLNFLLEVDWPQGRMVREYTVLLDPPVFMTPSATQRNTASDTPTVVERGEESLLTPTPIERDSAADGEEVALDGLLDDAATAAGATAADAANAGEAVSLDSLEAGADSAALSDSDGEAVSLTDLNAPNPDAKAEFAADQQARQAAALDEIPDVELLGSATEVTDDFVVGTDAVKSAVDDAGEVVSLEDESDIVALEEDSDVVSLDEIDSEQSTAAEPVANKEITVKSGDTLYELAQSNLADGVSVQQMMMSLLNTNQNAFINNNINLVKAGAVIRIPQASEAKALSQAQALAEIGKQNQLWQEYRDNLRSTAATRLADAGASAMDKPAPNTADAAGETDGLSDDAKSILDNARAEILDRDELSIVADNEPTSTTASATADESDASDTQRLGEINRKLKLAREELASQRLETEDLGDQASDLQHTTENLDALVTLRQNEVAQLEAQLADARERGAEADTTDAAGDAIADAADAAGSELQAAATDAADSAADGLADASSVVGDAAAELADSGSNALTEAGEKLETVELIDGDGESAADGDVVADAENAATSAESLRPQGAWYDNILNDKNKLALAGVGGAGLLGLGALLFWRRRRDDDEMLDFDDEVEFIDDGEAAGLQAEVDATAGRDDTDNDSTGGFVTGAAAGAAAMGGAFAAGSDDGDDLPEFTTASEKLADASRGEDIDKDDTISEADVYLAYGLHGQAEELLTGAIQRDPNNPEYARKLLQTYHAQGNGEAFDTTAQDFHTRFGGDNNPEWPGIAVMGLELQPGNDFYASAAATVDSVGMGDHNAPKLDADDFLEAGLGGGASSVTRDFSAADDVLDFSSEDESALMDQSIDPAFAFDESDLEATGDFSQIASELSVENTDSIDFPDFDSASAVDDAVTGVGSGISSAKGAIAGAAAGIAAAGVGAADSLDLGDALDKADVFDASESFEDALSLDELDVGLPASGAANDGFEELDLSSIADDLTLDLEQLSGDMELDSSELLDGSLGGVDLEIPDLTSDNELLDGVGGNLDDADEMDTMLDLAKAYIDMGDKDSASSALGEIVKSGSPEQVSEAETLLRKIS